LANVRPSEPQVLLDEALEWVAPRNKVNRRNKDEQRQYALYRIELILRTHGINPNEYRRSDGTSETACEVIGLDRPPELNICEEELLQVSVFIYKIIKSNIFNLYFLKAEYFRHDFIKRYIYDIDEDNNDINRNQNIINGKMYQEHYDKAIAKANRDQKNFIDSVTEAAKRVYEERKDPLWTDDGKNNRLFFLTGDGGTGKTFVYNVNLFINV